MNKYEIWDHWTKLGEAEGYTRNHAIQDIPPNQWRCVDQNVRIRGLTCNINLSLG